VNGAPQGQLPDLASVPEAYREYVITDEDGKWVGPLPRSPAEQEKLKALPYTDLWELVAEKFHCSVNFLHELNPTPADLKVGDTVKVPNVPEFAMADVVALEKQRREEKKQKDLAAKAAAEASPTPSLQGDASPAPTPTLAPTPAPPLYHLVLLRPDRLIEVYEGDKMVACFPCTPGSKDVPVPEGRWKVTSNILLPYYRWDKSVLDSGVRSENAFNLPPGPNSPVGIVWMGINRPSVGMHGTTSPDQIGRNESHGCIRLANWDAFLLSQMIGKGTQVEVR